jgi:hypothetical protein
VPRAQTRVTSVEEIALGVAAVAVGLRQVEQQRAHQLAGLVALDGGRQREQVVAGAGGGPGALELAHHVALAELVGEAVQLEHLGGIDPLVGLGEVSEQGQEHLPLGRIEFVYVHRRPLGAG